MKQKVIIFTGKHQIKPIGKKEPEGAYDEAALMKIADKIFPSDKYDVEVVDYPKCRCFYDINNIWKRVRMPILIGFDSGANYIEPIKNYKRKYLISPLVIPYSLNDTSHKDEYDEENTICLFGGDEKSVKNAHLYAQAYPHTHSEMTDGFLDLCSGMELLGIFDALMFRGKRQ